MKNQEIVRIFNDIAGLLEIRGENPFRIRAYRRAASTIENLTSDVAESSKEELMRLPGIGSDLAAKVEEYISSGRMRAYEELKREMPEGLGTLLAVPGLGPKTARLLFNQLKVNGIEDLERLALEHKLSELSGIKRKTEENILAGIQMLKRGMGRLPLFKASQFAHGLVGELKKRAPIRKAAIVGSIRRWKETVGHIKIIALSDDPESVIRTFVRFPNVKAILLGEPHRASVMFYNGLQGELHLVKTGSFGAAMAYFTGSRAHIGKLNELALKKGFELNETGIFRAADRHKLAGEREKEIYETLGVSFIPPELREDTGEIEAAMEGLLPRPVSFTDIKGDLHVHSNMSDGRHDIAELAEEARTRGYEYIAVTDHSKGLGIARGLSAERLLAQKKEIETINERLSGFRILAGVEVDILTGGGLDFPDEILKEMDFVIASIHSGFRQDGGLITKRIISAMRNPYVTAIGHPTGRLIGERDPYPVDMEKVLSEARETGTAMEINSYPLRLDLNDLQARAAKRMGVKIVINTDAHTKSQFEYMNYGVAVARRAWLEKDNVLNALGYEELMKALKVKRVKLLGTS